MRSSGKRSELIVLQRATTAADSHNEQIETWGEIGQEWAYVQLGRGAERRQAAQTQAAQAVTFQVLDNPLTRSLTARDRVLWNGVAWDIAAPGVPLEPGELDITAVGSVS